MRRGAADQWVIAASRDETFGQRVQDFPDGQELSGQEGNVNHIDGSKDPPLIIKGSLLGCDRSPSILFWETRRAKKCDRCKYNSSGPKILLGGRLLRPSGKWIKDKS